MYVYVQLCVYVAMYVAMSMYLLMCMYVCMYVKLDINLNEPRSTVVSIPPSQLESSEFKCRAEDWTSSLKFLAAYLLRPSRRLLEQYLI
jgi:hypothetical protein